MECVLCMEAVTNPVCASCLEAQMSIWLKETRSELVSELREKTNEISFGLNIVDACILCNKDMNVCTYCYTEYIFNWLVDNNKDLAEKFMTYFNFDLEHRGYHKKAEKLGLIA